MGSATSRAFGRLAVAARVFVLLALVGPALWARDTASFPALVALAVVLGVGAIAAQQRWQLTASSDLLEATAVGVVVALPAETSPGLLAALALPPFLSGLRHGNRGVAEAMTAQLIGVVATATLVGGGIEGGFGVAIFTWTVCGLGFGLVAGFLHTFLRREPDSVAGYREARQLLRELLDLSGDLSSGLDPVSQADSLLIAVRDELPACDLAVHVPQHDGLTPLTRSRVSTETPEGESPTADPEQSARLAERVLATGRPLTRGQDFAFPLTAGGAIVAVVAGSLSERLSPDQVGLSTRLGALSRSLSADAVRLEASLLFGQLRDAATSEERRRLAREMHDGMAQEIASMGYFVDGLIAAAESPEQGTQLLLLRESITSVVAEVRRSVLTLRSAVDGSDSLGAAIGGVARHLSALSGVPISVTVDEGTVRLRPEVEAELMRITQEALNNAVRHAQASRIDVACEVSPPEVSITVRDNGRGLQQKRVDSHGLEIMQERARLVGATLDIGNHPDGGALVSLRISGDAARGAAVSDHDRESVLP
ncbi:sensor histidine kinase [Nocardioides sp.]|uniref:sensor histidine kinase n=1 Tax=Nocardioides sp. TaxID=35761 RepID=UPI003528B373